MAKESLEYLHEADSFFAVYLPRRGHRFHWYAGGIPYMGRPHSWLGCFFYRMGVAAIRKGGLTMPGPIIGALVFIGAIAFFGLRYARKHGHVD